MGYGKAPFYSVGDLVYLQSSRRRIGPLLVAVVVGSGLYELAKEDGSAYLEGTQSRFKEAELNAVPK